MLPCLKFSDYTRWKMVDWLDRKIGETDEELRKRHEDFSIAKRARAAIWRVYGLPNKDYKMFKGANAFLMLNGKRVAMFTNIDMDIDVAGGAPIESLGRFSVEGKTDE